MELYLYDDEEKVSKKYAIDLLKIPEVKSNFKVEALVNEDFAEEINVLEKRREQLRDGKDASVDSTLDKATILIIDYDLLKNSKSAYLTGENVAYLTRCFSKCSFIIGINQFPPYDNAFDLTLRDHPESYCDLNVDSTQILNSGLWSERKQEFRPWYWPIIPQYLNSVAKRIKETEEHLDDPILKTIGLDLSFSLFSRTSLEFLGNDPQNVTFREFALKSGKGLRSKDSNDDDSIIGRIASSKVAIWLEKIVLPGQDILVDAPHLVSRYPSLLEGPHETQETWNKVANPQLLDTLNVDHEKLDCYKFKNDFWLSRPAWYWAEICKDQKIKEVISPWKREKTQYQFCEDSSTFKKQKECLEFRADVDSVYTQRFVNSPLIDGVNYQPRVRIL